MDNKNDIAIQITGLKKRYRLGTIGGGTLQGDIQSWWAKIRKKDDPNLKIGQKRSHKNEMFMALNGIDLEIKKGERVGIIGHNGAGKSTLLKLLSRVTAPAEGTICIDGRISSMLEVGTGFNPELTGRENIYLNGAILGMTKVEVDRKIDEIIAFSECGQFIDTPVKRYSSGMYVKLAFSVAAHLDSEILIMDEVLAVGDMAFQKKCLNKMNEVSQNEGRTILYVSHNMSTIRQLCNRCVVLSKGTVIYDGEVENGIETYLGTVGSVKQIYEYSKEQRKEKRSNDNFVIKSLQVLSNVDKPFNLNEPIHLALCCYSRNKINDLYFRFEIKFQDGTLVGTMLTGNTASFEENQEKRIYMCADAAHLMPGRYMVDIVAYVKNPFGVETFVDGVYPGFIFEITDELEDGNKLVWNHMFWGHTKLHDITIMPMNG